MCIYAVGISDYALREKTPLGASSFSTVVEKAKRLPEVERGFLVTDRDPELFTGSWPEDFGPIVSRNFTGLSELLETVREETKEGDHLFFLWGDTPLVDPKMAEGMYARHVRYFASYTFADGYPQGLAPEIIRTDTLTQLLELSRRHEIDLGRSMLFELIQKDINAFDLETEVAPKDQRLYRILLAADTRRNFLLLNGIIEMGGRDADSVVRLVEEHQEVLRTLPAYMQVQITGDCPQSCAYCPYPRVAVEGKMSLEKWRSLMEDAHGFCDDLVVGIGLWGEPALHDEIAEFVEAVLEYPSFHCVIETSGVGWSAEALEAISRLDRERIDWIVSLDAATEETYRKLRGPQWEEAQAAISMLREFFSDARVHVQAVRIEENEGELERFYRHWKQEGIPLIVQKYDHFCGFLPERKVTDLSPLNRFPCYHLKRDLSVLIDGEVRMCREDLSGEYSVGNIFDEGMEAVWEKLKPFYLRHISEDLPPLCESCDEYYTFNF